MDLYILVLVHTGPWPTSTVSQSALFPPPHSSTRRSGCNHQMLPSPSSKTVAGVTAPLGQSTEIESLFPGLERHSQNRQPDLFRIFKFNIQIWAKSDIIIPRIHSIDTMK